MANIALPWAPLISIGRAHYPERTLYGLCAVWDNANEKPILSVGGTQTALWTRSIIKPWQLLTIAPVLSEAYKSLTPQHWALMMSSHSGEAHHQELLDTLMQLGKLKLSHLKCPSCYPLNAQERYKLELEHSKDSPLFHPCSGKHVGYLLAHQASGYPIADYLEPHEWGFYDFVQMALGVWLKKDPNTIAQSQDSCGMPNFSLSGQEMAQLYDQLVNPNQQYTERSGLAWSNHTPQPLATLMQTQAPIIGGTNRLDTQLMQGQMLSTPSLTVVAKEGADGLLAVGIGPTEQYNNGLGLLIKLASGYDSQHLEWVLRAVLTTLGIQTTQDDKGLSKLPLPHWEVHWQNNPTETLTEKLSSC